MKWIKASERLPDDLKRERPIKESNLYWIAWYSEERKKWLTDYDQSFEDVEWLDEQPYSDNDKEIDDLKHAVDSFESMAKEFKKEIEHLKRMNRAELEDKYEGRIETLEELVDAQAEYIKFLDKETVPFVQFASVHGMEVAKAVSNEGKAHREKIWQLKNNL